MESRPMEQRTRRTVLSLTESSGPIMKRLSFPLGKVILNKCVVVCFITLFNFYKTGERGCEGIMHCFKPLLKSTKNKAVKNVEMTLCFFY